MIHRISFLAVVFVAITAFAMTACDDGSAGGPAVVLDDLMEEELPLSAYDVTYSAEGTDVSRFLGWQWKKEISGDGLNFHWVFKNNGGIEDVHCCGLGFFDHFCYVVRGNVLLTYGSEMGMFKIEATTFTMADDGLSFTRDNGQMFTRAGQDIDGLSFADKPVALTNDLLGSWQDGDGTEYEFCTDATLRINDAEYGYLVMKKTLEVVTIGPLVDGETASLCKYKFARKTDKLLLRRSSDDVLLTLSPVAAE
jgi:hypothetical protein